MGFKAQARDFYGRRSACSRPLASLKPRAPYSLLDGKVYTDFGRYGTAEVSVSFSSAWNSSYIPEVISQLKLGLSKAFDQLSTRLFPKPPRFPKISSELSYFKSPFHENIELLWDTHIIKCVISNIDLDTCNTKRDELVSKSIKYTQQLLTNYTNHSTPLFKTTNLSRHDPACPLIDITAKSGLKAFAPTWAMILDLNSNKINEQKFTEIYTQHLRNSYLRYRADWDLLLSMKSFSLACFCRMDDFCHRDILSDILVKLGAINLGFH